MGKQRLDQVSALSLAKAFSSASKKVYPDSNRDQKKFRHSLQIHGQHIYRDG